MFEGLWFFCSFAWKNEKRYLLYNILYQIIHSLIPLVNVTMPKFLIDELLGKQRPELLALYTGLLVGYNFLAGSLSNWLFLSVFTLRSKIGAAFGKMLHQKLANADLENLESPDFLDRKEKAEKFLYGDWHGFSSVLENALMVGGQAVTLLGIAAIVTSLHVWMILLFLALVTVDSLVEAAAKKKEMALSLEQAQVERGWAYFGSLFESVQYGKEIRANDIGGWLLEKESEYAEQVLGYYRRRNHFLIHSATVSTFLTLLQQCASYAYLIARTAAGAISIGDFSMFAGAAAAFSGSVRAVMTGVAGIRAYGVYYDAVQDYLNVPEKIRCSGTAPIPSGPHTLEFRDVSFRYTGQNDWALRHVSLILQPGEKLSVVGENGAGKTTFTKLLLRLYEPTEGAIFLDGTDIREIDLREYTTLFSSIFQDYKLFSLSLLENVSLSAYKNAKEVETVLQRVGLGGQLDRLPKGVYTSIGKSFDPEGFEPSGGEGQKIALARALCRNTPIVILDEPTAALDPKAEFEIYQHFNELVQGKTAVYISHRLSSAKFCDRIAVFEHGTILELGTHEELLRQDGKYAELFRMQAQFYQ